jgi:PHD/YefM family antitoxin component YafN of YafNO toxin-antitoxin module
VVENLFVDEEQRLNGSIHSLTDFLRNTKSHMSRMKRSKRPLVLTVNGRAELIVQDARSYQALLELADRAEAIEGIRRGLESMARGEGRPAEQVLEELRKKHKIPRRT